MHGANRRLHRKVKQGFDLSRRAVAARLRIALHQFSSRRALIKHLMGDVAELLFGEAIGQQQHRRAFQRSAGNPIQRIHQPRPLGGQHHTGCAGHFRIRHRHHRGIAFMPRQDEANAKTLSRRDDIQ